MRHTSWYPRRGTSIGCLLFGALVIQTGWCGPVSVNVTSKAGSAAEDAVVVFDPLDTPVPAAGTLTMKIDQVNKRFVPRVSVIRTGTRVSFPNSDRIRHEVYSFSPAHPFTLKLYSGSPNVEERFAKSGLVVLGCNIHDTMVGFVAVVDSPYFVKLPASGSATLTLPAGRYRLRVWHPKLREAFASLQLTVGSDPLTLPLTVDLDPSHEAAGFWPE